MASPRGGGRVSPFDRASAATLDIARRADRRGSGRARIVQFTVSGAGTAGPPSRPGPRPASCSGRRGCSRAMSCSFTIYDQRSQAVVAFDSGVPGPADVSDHTLGDGHDLRNRGTAPAARALSHQCRPEYRAGVAGPSRRGGHLRGRAGSDAGTTRGRGPRLREYLRPPPMAPAGEGTRRGREPGRRKRPRQRSHDIPQRGGLPRPRPSGAFSDRLTPTGSSFWSTTGRPTGGPKSPARYASSHPGRVRYLEHRATPTVA